MNKIYYIDITNINLKDIDLNLISDQRLNKANLLVEDRKKVQSLVSYLLLRYLFKKLNINLNEYNFSYINTKPFIKELNYHFSITHSHNIVAVIISEDEVGVDAQMIDLSKNIPSLVKYTLSDNETFEFNNLDESQKPNYFYSKWVMKEAYFKMNGTGLTKKFKDVTLDYKVHFIKDLTGKSYCISSTIDTSTVLIDFNTINN